MDGVQSPYVKAWHIKNPELPVEHYLASDWFADGVMGGVTRTRQGTADRGTLTNKVWDAMNDGDVGTVVDAISLMEELWDAEAEAARIATVEYNFAYAEGLVDEKDKPKRGYQCSKDDVAPYVTNLFIWFDSQTNWMPTRRQGLVSCDDKKIVGTYDDLGKWNGVNMLLDLKTATSPQPAIYNMVQLALYWYLLGSRGDVQAMNLIVTPDGVCPRMLSDRGFTTGLKLAWDALDILNNSSMSGMFKSQKDTNAYEALKS